MTALDGAGAVCEHVTETVAARGHEQELFDQRRVPPRQLETAGVFPGDDAALVQLERPPDRRSHRRGVEAEIVADVVEANDGFNAIDAEVRAKFSERHVLRSVTLAVSIGVAGLEVVQRPAIHRTTKTPIHPGTILIDVMRIERLSPRGLLIVLRAHRPEDSARLV